MSVLSDRITVGVLCGGKSPERAGSLVSGQAAAGALRRQGIRADLIDLVEMPDDLRIDVALMALHGPPGEDGKVQGALEMAGVPYTGSGVLASAVGMFKPAFKHILSGVGIDTPRFMQLSPQGDPMAIAEEAADRFRLPVVLKPASGGGSLGTTVAHTVEELVTVLQAGSVEYQTFIVEEFTPGIDVTAGILESDSVARCFPLLEMETDRDFFDYVAKHDPDQRRYFCPARVSTEQAAEVRDIALRVHKAVGAWGVSRVDFRITPGGRISVLEINTGPGLSPSGNLATMANAAGLNYDDLIIALMGTAFNKPSYVP
ncbi:D-alanine--D-alanine ligase family protein [Parafrankia elaeagni]|uniref:D-alanine--D-alanine ligase family protein n=1 Tax=Parafrankia elaeagni TaxID=222534 RepID=UPI000375E6A4|nr:D-alanine--D-alanine ligase [Parafrankia elaeagni]